MPNIVGDWFDPDTPCGCCNSREEHERKYDRRKREEARIYKRKDDAFEQMSQKGFTDHEIRKIAQAIQDADRLRR